MIKNIILNFNIKIIEINIYIIKYKTIYFILIYYHRSNIKTIIFAFFIK